MSDNWMLIDSSYLGYRAAYAIRDSSSPVYGFLATITSLRDRFDCDNFAFCFDHDNLKRREILPTYKERRYNNPDHEEQHVEARKCIERLRTHILPELGFENVFVQDGYEADDIIASIVQNSLEDSEAVIVSSDADLFQLLSDKVVMWHPTREKVITEKSFSDEWFGLTPQQWPSVKAIAGCSSDNIKGIPGVGEKTAAKYIAGLLPFYSKKSQLIGNCSEKDYLFRHKLVKLPFEGVDQFWLEEDEIDWREVSTYTVEDDDGW